jgi:hypothetical protein
MPSAAALTIMLAERNGAATFAPEIPLVRTIQCLSVFEAYWGGIFLSDHPNHAMTAAAAATVKAVISMTLQPLQNRSSGSDISPVSKASIDLAPLRDFEWTDIQRSSANPECI